jgi:hypothetical protein
MDLRSGAAIAEYASGAWSGRTPSLRVRVRGGLEIGAAHGLGIDGLLDTVNFYVHVIADFSDVVFGGHVHYDVFDTRGKIADFSPCFAKPLRISAAIFPRFAASALSVIFFAMNQLWKGRVQGEGRGLARPLGFVNFA